MKQNMLFFALFVSLCWTACTEEEMPKQLEPMVEVINTDTLVLSCDSGKPPLTLVFLGDQGNYERVTLITGSLDVDLLANASDDGFKYVAADNSYTLIQSQEMYSIYKDSVLLMSCNIGEAGHVYKTSTGIEFTVDATNTKSASIANIRVFTRGLTVQELDTIIADSDPIKSCLLLDNNRDGFDELYMVTEVVGSGGYADVVAFITDKDQTVSVVEMPEADDQDMKAGGLFEGYQGHDKVYVENGKLIRKFPVYKLGDDNANPTGGFRKIEYALLKSTSGYALKPTLIK